MYHSIDPFIYARKQLFRLSFHACEQMRTRMITRSLVSAIICNGFYFQDPERPSTCIEWHGQRVVVDRSTLPATIITVMNTPSLHRDQF